MKNKKVDYGTKVKVVVRKPNPTRPKNKKNTA